MVYYENKGIKVTDEGYISESIEQMARDFKKSGGELVIPDKVFQRVEGW